MAGPEEPREGLGGRTAAEDHVWGDGFSFQGPQLLFKGIQFAISSLFRADNWAKQLQIITR